MGQVLGCLEVGHVLLSMSGAVKEKEGSWAVNERNRSRAVKVWDRSGAVKKWDRSCCQGVEQALGCQRVGQV